MRNRMLAVICGALCISTTVSAQSAVPAAIAERVNQLVATCVQAGGKLGSLTGQGRFVIPADFNGDGRLDFVVSEGNVPCTGRPTLFRPDGLARVELYVGDASGNAQLAFSDQLLAYRVLPGTPARLQIARRGPACGAPRCGDELRWNAAASRFDEHATDGRQVAARPAAGAAGPQAVAARAPAPAAGGAASATLPPVQPGAEARFKASCRKRILAQAGQQAAKWVDSECAENWTRALAAQPLAEAVLIAQGAGPGPVDSVRRLLSGVRWGPRAEQGQLASGRIGGYAAGLEGAAGRADRLVLGWRATGAQIPVDLPVALEARGATLTLTSCENQGPGEGERAWQVSLPGRSPFALTISERTAPTGSAWSFWHAEARLDARPARKGPTRCEPFW
jgi:hypothetical protein